MNNNAIAPETSLTVEKLAASIDPSANARRHNTELPANAIRASVVSAATRNVFASEVGFDVTIEQSGSIGEQLIVSSAGPIRLHSACCRKQCDNELGY